MNRQVWKHSIPISLIGLVPAVFELPAGAQIVHVREQGQDSIALWFLVDADTHFTAKEVRTFSVYGTGHGPIHLNEVYVGTAIFSGGSLVLHVFEVAQIREKAEMKEVAAHAN